MRPAIRSASSISLFTLLSRVLGFVRDWVMVRVFGPSWVMGTFLLAWMLPNLLRRLMGEGALSASFIPVYSAALDRDGKPAANRLLASVTGVVVLSLSALSAIVVAACLLLPPEWVGQASEDGASVQTSGTLLLELTAILFPYVILICVVALYSGALNAHGVFGLPAAQPVILNVFWIAGLWLAQFAFGDDLGALAKLMGVFLLVAGGAQLFAVGLQLRARGCLPAPRLLAAADPARVVFARMAPTVIGLSMLQISALLDQTFAYYLIDPGAGSHVYLANRLMLFPHALTSLALATVVFPRFAVLAARQQTDALQAEIEAALRVTVLLTVPATLGLVLVAPEFFQLCFVSDKFTAADAVISARTTSCLVIGLPFVGVAQLYARVLYALGEMRVPARVTAILVPLNVGLNAFFVLVCDFGVAGLTLGTSLCAVGNAWALHRVLGQRSARPHLGPQGLLRTTLATAAMAATVLAVRSVPATTTIGIGVWHVALPILAGVVCYFGVHLALGSEELWRLLRRNSAS